VDEPPQKQATDEIPEMSSEPVQFEAVLGEEGE
jgi:hypothetical protein